MNIITLYDSLNIGLKDTFVLTDQEIIRIEKQVSVEKKINKAIDTNTASNLIIALKNYPEIFYFVYNNARFYNFLSQKPFPNKLKPSINAAIDSVTVKQFIDNFLADDIVLFFNKFISKNDFSPIVVLLNEKKYLSEDILFKLNKRMLIKIEFAVAQLSLSQLDKSKILYVKDKNFYLLLNHFGGDAMDWKINSLISIAADVYNRNRVKDFLKSTMIAMAYYQAEDLEIAKILKSNKKAVSDWFGIGAASLGTRVFFFAIFIIIKILIVCVKCS